MEGVEVKWSEALLKTAEEVMIKGGKLEFIVYKREPNKRKPIIHKYIDNEITCDEEILTE